MTLDQETLYQLFQMTPYAYKTSIEDKQRLLDIQNLDVTCQFRIRVYEKHPCRCFLFILIFMIT